ncbi:MAG: hypothetical protein JWP02_982, partial [Acidimicrobiales bacterium]|nr:hypothetical protein [Acidimicrobiales bacterium]
MRPSKLMVIGIAGLVLSVAMPAEAQTTTTAGTRRAQAQTAALDTIKGKANTAIDNRL